MVDDPVMEMYEAQAELILTKEELEKIRRENEELKNQITDDSSMKKGDILFVIYHNFQSPIMRLQ